MTCGLGWLAILRLGVAQAALGAIVVLTTSTLNRVMVVELGLAAAIPGALVGWHYAVQMSRPAFGHRSDSGRGRTVWILGGLALLALAGTGAAATTLLFERSVALGLAAAVVAFALIGAGVGAAGTSLLALLASRTAPERRPAAATVVWMMMIFGIVLTAALSGAALDPYSHGRLIAVTAAAGTLAFALAALAVRGVERRAALPVERPPSASFRRALAEVWNDAAARLFTLFVFLSMLAYSAQDLVLEPFGGLLFGMTPGQTTQLGGVQHAGVLLGMALVGALGGVLAKRRPGVLKAFIIAGCLGSGLALGGLALGAAAAPSWPLTANVFVLGLANGVFAVAAIGTMMALAGDGRDSGEGIRMGVWGAAQAIAFGLGGFLGAAALDVVRLATDSTPAAFAAVFGAEAALFVAAAALALRIGAPARPPVLVPAE